MDAGGKISELDGDAPESTDFANYFCTYAYIYHQASSYCMRSAGFRRTGKHIPERVEQPRLADQPCL